LRERCECRASFARELILTFGQASAQNAKNLWLRLNHTPVGTLQTDYRGRCVDKNIFFSLQRINLRKRES
jgi:hypothetical protein